MLAALPKDSSSVPSTCHDCLSLQLQGDLTPFAMGTDTHMTYSHTNIHINIPISSSMIASKGGYPCAITIRLIKLPGFFF